MLIRKAYRFRLKTNTESERVLELFAGHCRFVWNQFWRINDNRLYRLLPIMRYQEMAFWLTLWKKSEDRGWLSEAHSQVLQQKIMDLDRAYKDAFDRDQPNKRLPVLRRKQIHNSFRFVQGFKVDNRRLYLPKIGWVSFFKSQDIVGHQKNITISKRQGQWYASVQVEQEVVQPVHGAKSVIGVDLGIAKLVTLSDGTVYASQNSYRHHQARLGKEQCKLAKRKKYSQNWTKQSRRVHRVHARITNVRRDYLHKISDQVCKNHAMICIEDLKISNMSRSARGTRDAPGVNVKAKSSLNKSILDQGWYEFRRQLEYKSIWRGGQVVAVDPRYSSQLCSVCGHGSKNNRLSQAMFCCQSCGFTLNADVNAARNILARGIKSMAAGQAVSVCGEIPPGVSAKQKPVRNRRPASREKVSPNVDAHVGILGL